MNTFAHRTRRLLVVSIVTLAMVFAGFPIPAAHAQAQPEWRAWHLKVDFPVPLPGKPVRPRVYYTWYSGSGTNPSPTWQRSNISSDCDVQGLLWLDADGYAQFDGKTTRIRCRIPPKPPGLVASDHGAFWVAADVRLKPKRSNNPILEGTAGPNHEFTFSLPSKTGLTARTQLELPAHTYTSPEWNQDSLAGNRMVIGANGPTMVAVTDYFNSHGYDWLGFLNSWQGYFADPATASKVKHLVQAPDDTWTTNRSGSLWTNPEYVYIGYSPTTGTYFEGGLRNAEIDPPGCHGG